MAVSGTTAPFFVTAFGFAALWGRHRDALRPFERWALPLLLVLALSAMRNATWFELALAVSLPRLLDAARPAVEPDEAVRRANVVLGAAAAAFALAVLGTHLAKPAAWFDRTGTPAQAAAAARAAGPHGVVLADDDHSDWLLWQRPELSGRVAYDVRFELFDARALARIVRLSHLDRPAWSAWARRHGLVPFRPAS
jgi:hypothetical protein